MNGSRHAWLTSLRASALGASVALIAILAACSSVEGPQYGGPGSLANIPPPKKDLGTAGGGGGGGVCTTAKRIPTDPACTVKWSTDIFPKMKSDGAWKCGGPTCHASGQSDPVILDADANTTYENLTKRTTSGKPYLNPCSKVIGDSSFACNTLATAPGCANAMPLPAGVPEGDKAAINTWVQCGSPNN